MSNIYPVKSRFSGRCVFRNYFETHLAGDRMIRGQEIERNIPLLSGNPNGFPTSGRFFARAPYFAPRYPSGPGPSEAGTFCISITLNYAKGAPFRRKSAARTVNQSFPPPVEDGCGVPSIALFFQNGWSIKLPTVIRPTPPGISTTKEIRLARIPMVRRSVSRYVDGNNRYNNPIR